MAKFTAIICLRLLAVLMAFGSSSCAAKLPREVSIKRPLGEAKPFDADAIQLTRLSDQTSVTLGQYMRDQQLKYLVLTFGSQGCAVCMQKARYLQANLVSNDYSLLGSAAKSVVELVGVLTDPTSSRDELLELVDRDGLTHLSWTDPGHNIMMNYFQPEGRNFSVPLTVMVSQTEILWRVPSWEHTTGPELIEKIAATLGVDANPPPVDPADPADGISQPLLAREVPNRFDEVTVSNCQDRSEVQLSSLLPSSQFDFRAVFVRQKQCQGDENCMNSQAALEQWVGECETKFGKTCVVRDIITDPTLCEGNAGLFSGGKEFYSVFSDHFNWAYAPLEVGAGRFKLADVSGPLTLIFDKSGRLVYSREGNVGGTLIARMNSDGLTNREPGPAFPVWLEPMQTKDSINAQLKASGQCFADIRRNSKYSLFMFWNTWCGSCLEELDEWHQQSDSVYNFCRSQPEFCQVVALETGRGETDMSPSDYLNGLVNGNDDFEGWSKKNWTMALAVEDLPLSDGRAPNGWFDGWFRARFGSKEPRNVLYDREGKVLGSWLGLPGEHGPRDALKKLFEQESKGGQQ